MFTTGDLKLFPSAKLNEALRIVQDWLAEAPDDKIIVFSQWRPYMVMLNTLLKEHEMYNAISSSIPRGELFIVKYDLEISEESSKFVHSEGILIRCQYMLKEDEMMTLALNTSRMMSILALNLLRLELKQLRKGLCKTHCRCL